MTERLYTLDEAKRELAVRQCRMHGHDIDIILAGADPLRLVCGRCGKTWGVQPAKEEA